MNFSSQIFFNVINHGYRQNSYIKEKLFVAASILCGVATYFYYEKVRRTIRTAIVSNLLKLLIIFVLLVHTRIFFLKYYIRSK